MDASPGPKSLLQQEIERARPFRSRAQEATVGILRTADVLRREIGKVVEPHGITSQQYNVLRILRGAHPDPLATLEIRDRMIERAPGITRIADRLEALGFISRERCASDRRMVHCRITEAGLTLLRSLDPLVDAADESLVSAQGPRRIEALIQSLQEIRQAAAG